MSLGGDPPWRYSDPFRLKLRIHTKQIDTIDCMTTILQIADSVTAQVERRGTIATDRCRATVRSQLRFGGHEGTAGQRGAARGEFLPMDRSQNRYHGKIDIAVQKKFKDGDNAEIDPLVGLVEEIADVFRMKRLDSLVAARCIHVENSVLYSTEHWEQLRQFTSLLTLTFELAK